MNPWLRGYIGRVMGRSATVFALCALLLFGACSNGNTSPELQIDTGSFTEDELRIQIRQMVIAGPRGMQADCVRFAGQSDVQAIRSFTGFNQMANRTPVATPDPDDEIRAAAILRDECKMLFVR